MHYLKQQLYVIAIHLRDSYLFRSKIRILGIIVKDQSVAFSVLSYPSHLPRWDFEASETLRMWYHRASITLYS